MPRALLLSALTLLALASPAPAADGVVALGERSDLSSGGPQISGDRVVLGREAPGRLRLWSMLPDGSMRTGLLDVRIPARVFGWDLAASASRVAVRASWSVGQRGREDLFAGALAEPITALATRLGSYLRDGRRPDVFVAGEEAITLERRPGHRVRALARSPEGSVRAVALPPGADARRLAVNGALAAAPLGRAPDEDRAVVVVDQRTGAIVRRVPFPSPVPVLTLGLGADGSLAASSELAGIGQVLLWSPAGSERFAVYDHSAQPEGIGVAGRRVAIVDQPVSSNAMRVAVLELPAALPAELRTLQAPVPVLFRGPAHAAVRSLSFDGQRLAWASDHCQYAAVVGARSRRSVPRGPCIRTEIDTVTFVSPEYDRSARRGRPFMAVRCLTGPAGRCRVRVTAVGNVGVLGRRSAAIRERRTGRVTVPVRGRRALRYLRKDPSLISFRVRLSDPSGKSRTKDAL